MVYFAATTLILTLAVFIRSVAGIRSIVKLTNVPADEIDQGDLPTVSIVVAARNEQKNIEPALRSLLSIDYPNLQLIVVNDRSTDSTGEILDSLARDAAELMIIHIAALPTGWLGKNHALHVGAAAATGEYILFTDADIIFDPSTLRRAICYAKCHDLSHLTATPQTVMPGLMLSSFATSFMICFLSIFPPWQARNSKSKVAVGIGAFNLVRRDVYLNVGGHEPIRMRPDDDVKLGKLIKQSGYSQDVVNGTGVIRVPWYETVRDAIVGLEKNTFAGVDYSILRTVAGTLFMLALYVWPFSAVFCTTGIVWWLGVAQIAVLLTLSAWAARVIGVPVRSCVLFPLSSCLIIFIGWRTMILTFRNDGISWRGTHYPLADLKANQI
ncbi:MAG: glycosyltransferase [Planctomycetales bacterium]|nr:glycosyltransferase [Planctomycetales bacterium]